MQGNIAIYGSKRLKAKHDRSNSVLNQGRRILLAKIPPDVTADFRSISSQRSHYKATESFYMQVNPSLKIRKNDLDIKRCLGVDKEARALERQ